MLTLVQYRTRGFDSEYTPGQGHPGQQKPCIPTLKCHVHAVGKLREPCQCNIESPQCRLSMLANIRVGTELSVPTGGTITDGLSMPLASNTDLL